MQNEWKFWLATLGFSLWSWVTGVFMPVEWGGTSTEASPDALKQQLQGAGANSHLVPGVSLWAAAGTVGSRWALGSQEMAVEQQETYKEAGSSAVVIQQGWFGLLLRWEHLRMMYRSDHSWKAIYLQLFLLSCRQGKDLCNGALESMRYQLSLQWWWLKAFCTTIVLLADLSPL